MPEIFAESMRQRRCVVTQARLGPNELVASRSRMPSLYGGRPIADEVKILDYLLQCAHAVLVCDMLERSHVDTIRRFFLTIIDNSQLRSERCLHLYLYHFWDQLWRLDSEGIHLTEKFYEGMSNSQSSRFAERLLPRLCDQEARTDIVGFDELGRKLYLVEVKQGELDDRAIGQFFATIRTLAHNAIVSAMIWTSGAWCR
ncbi:hypothetical protein OV079_13010 [Nannocystis pusilla]|uniref:Uncharacterized protein n=1 Tax=Nannocystis pusilla TaxID=889268 RepID=A0A9X3IVM8_9BACT|nr:hypothetical protein [Nannocystis pusilla]MCY1006462.1 hypothetical protein [Nannocystis pusilla]